MTILDRLVAATTARLQRDQQQIPLPEMMRLAKNGNGRVPFAFERALKSDDVALICEIKKASPSKGIIAEDFPYLQIARDYEAAGAACISVLTETDYFKGSDDYLREIRQTVSIPVLRKDFTIDPYQIYQAKILGADAVLLICALLDTEKLREYIAVADSLGLSSLVEAHDEAEVESAVSAGSRIIGVNNRNLKTFEIDFQNSIRLRKMVPSETLFVSESGISTRRDIELLRDHGVNAVLIGESIMRQTDKHAAIRQLRSRQWTVDSGQ